MLATARRRGTGLADPEPVTTTGDSGGGSGGGDAKRSASSFLHVIRGLLLDAGAVGAVLVDGTEAVPSRFLCSPGVVGGVGGVADCVRRAGELERVSIPGAGGDGSGDGGGGDSGGGGGGNDAGGEVKLVAEDVAAADISTHARSSPASERSERSSPGDGNGDNGDDRRPSDEVVHIRPGGSMMKPPPPEKSLADGFWEGGARAAGDDDRRGDVGRGGGGGGGGGGSRRLSRGSGSARPAGEGVPETSPRRKLWFGWWAGKEEPKEEEAGGIGGESDGGDVAVPEIAASAAAAAAAPDSASADAWLDEESPPVDDRGGQEEEAAAEEEEEAVEEKQEEKEEEEEEKEELRYLQMLAQNALKNLEQEEQERHQHQHQAQRLHQPPHYTPQAGGSSSTAHGDPPPRLPEVDFYIGALGLALAFEADSPAPPAGGGPTGQSSTRNLTLEIPGGSHNGDDGTGDGSEVGVGGDGGEMVTVAATPPVGKIVAAPWPPSYLLEHVAQSRSAAEEAMGSPGSAYAGGSGGGGRGDGNREEGGRGVVVVTSVNCGYLDMAVNFLLSVRRAGAGVKVFHEVAVLSGIR